MSNKFTLFTLLFFSSLTLKAQSKKLDGIILEASSKQALPYASILLKGSSIGTLSNDKGEFELSSPVNFKADTIQISCLGYQTKYIAFSSESILQTIYLEALPVRLSEAVISDRKLSPQEIVEMAIKKIPQNYPEKPYAFDAFYRESRQENTHCVRFFEAALQVFDPGYQYTDGFDLHQKAYIKDVRKSDDLRSRQLWTFNELSTVLGSDQAHYPAHFHSALNKKYLRKSTVRLESIVSTDNKNIYKISVSHQQPGDTSLVMLFIDCTDYSIRQTEFYEKHYFQKNFGSRPSPCLRTDTVKCIFQEWQGKIYLQYVSNRMHDEAIDTAKGIGGGLQNYCYAEELLINRVYADSIPAFPGSKSIDMTKDFFELDHYEYHPDFWAAYNSLKRLPAEEKLIQEISAQKPISTQFSQPQQKEFRGKSNILSKISGPEHQISFALQLKLLNTNTASITPFDESNEESIVNIDGLPYWSRNADTIYFKSGNNWQYVALEKLEFRKGWGRSDTSFKIAVNESTQAIREISPEKVNQGAVNGIKTDLEIQTDNGLKIAFQKTGNTLALITQKKKKPAKVICKIPAELEDCYRLSLSPKEKYVAYVCSKSGLWVMKID